MNPCDDCSIENRYFCCRYHPETGETKVLRLEDGTKRTVCTDLNIEGRCMAMNDEERRGGACRSYECFHFKEEETYLTLCLKRIKMILRKGTVQ